MTRRLCLAFAILVFALSPSDAAILTVDCAFQPPFDEISTTLPEAVSGDTIVVHECLIGDGDYAPFDVSGLTDLTIVASDARSRAGVGSRALGVGVNPLGFLPIVVVDGTESVENDCIRAVGASNITIEGLLLSDCGARGVNVVGSTVTSIIGNRIVGAAAEGIRNLDSSGSRIVGNMVGFSGGDGIVVAGNSDNVFVFDNLIGFSALRGVAIKPPGPPPPAPAARTIAPTDTEVVNNTIRQNQNGCILEDGQGSRIERNSCVGSIQERQILIGAGSTEGEVVGNLGVIDDPGVNADEAENCPVAAPCG